MIKVVMWARGVRHEVELKEGQRLLAAGYMLGLDDMGFGDCGGNCNCGTCHVRVKTGIFPDMDREERFMLDTLPQAFADSRLACQLLAVPEAGPVEVEWMG